MADVIGQDAYRRAVALSRRRTGLSQRGLSTGTADVHAASSLYGNGSHADAAALQEDGLVIRTPSEA